ncbi:SipW-dependent-type signal peptide-containing protein [Flavobacterium sp. N2155]
MFVGCVFFVATWAYFSDVITSDCSSVL